MPIVVCFMVAELTILGAKKEIYLVTVQPHVLFTPQMHAGYSPLVCLGALLHKNWWEDNGCLECL